jgi:hypothetical protein
MPLTRSFESFSPPRRYDGQAFTQALIRECETQEGTYATIDTITLFPLDTNPASPQSRNFTTSNATLPDAWYIIRWVDALGASFDSDPVLYRTGTGGSGSVVTVAEVREFCESVGVETTDAEIEEARDLAEARIEDACGVSFTPKVATEEVESVNGWALFPHPRVIQVQEVDGETVNTGPYRTGRVPLNTGTHTVTYTHGWEEPPLPIKRAVKLLTRHMLSVDPTDFDERATSKTTELAAWSLVTPGFRGAIFPIPEVNQIVSDYAFVGDIV